MDIYGGGEKAVTSPRARAASGVKWSAVSQASRIGAQLLGVIILARLLPAEDFGIVAMAAVVTGFANMFRDMGTAAAIIQKSSLEPRLLDSVFWFNLAVSIIIALMVLLLSPVIAKGFGEPRLEAVLWLLVVAFPLTSLGVVHQALLERASRFQSVAVVESLAALTGLACAVWAAMRGWGVFSLVVQTLASSAIATLGFWLSSEWRPRRRWCGDEIRSLVAFSGNLLGFNVFNYFVRNTDSVLIGRFLGASDLGYYSMAYRLMLWPLQNISNVVGRALFPVFSRMQDDLKQLAHAYLLATSAIALITAPLMLGLFVLREPFVSVMLGTRWMPVADLLGWLAIVGLFQSIGTTVGALYLATGRTDVMFRWGIVAGLVVIVAFLIGLQWGVEGVAAAYSIASIILFWPSLIIPFRLIGLRVSGLIKRISPSILASLVMAVVITIEAAAWPENPENHIGRLAVLILSGCLIYLVVSLINQRKLMKEIFKTFLAR